MSEAYNIVAFLVGTFIHFFQKILPGTLSECHTVLIQISTDILLVLIWVQTVCKGY